MSAGARQIRHKNKLGQGKWLLMRITWMQMCNIHRCVCVVCVCGVCVCVRCVCACGVCVCAVYVCAVCVCVVCVCAWCVCVCVGGTIVSWKSCYFSEGGNWYSSSEEIWFVGLVLPDDLIFQETWEINILM